MVVGSTIAFLVITALENECTNEESYHAGQQGDREGYVEVETKFEFDGEGDGLRDEAKEPSHCSLWLYRRCLFFTCGTLVKYFWT